MKHQPDFWGLYYFLGHFLIFFFIPFFLACFTWESCDLNGFDFVIRFKNFCCVLHLMIWIWFGLVSQELILVLSLRVKMWLDQFKTTSTIYEMVFKFHNFFPHWYRNSKINFNTGKLENLHTFWLARNFHLKYSVLVITSPFPWLYIINPNFSRIKTSTCLEKIAWNHHITKIT